MALILFDIDGTLLNTSSERAFFYYLVKKRRLGIKQWSAFIWFLLRYGLVFKQHVFKKNKAYLSGLSVQETNALAETFVKEVLLHHIRPDVANLLKRHINKSDHVILLSGTLDCLAKALAKHLNIKTALATNCVIKNGTFTAQPPKQHPFQSVKRQVASDYAAQHQFDIKQSYAYGDSQYDISLMQSVGHPVAVYPDPTLQHHASLHQWQIIQ